MIYKPFDTVKPAYCANTYNVHCVYRMLLKGGINTEVVSHSRDYFKSSENSHY